MTVKTNIASSLKHFRKLSGLSTDEVGAAVDKSGKTIYAWEIGRGQPDGDELIVLCKLFGVHLRDFYGNEYADLVADEQPAPDLSPDEQELVECYRGTADFGRRAVLSLAREYREHMPRDTYRSGLPADFHDTPPYEPTAAELAEVAQWNAERTG